MRYACSICGWEYDESQGYDDYEIEPDTLFEDIPDDFECPYCYAGKDEFSKNEE